MVSATSLRIIGLLLSGFILSCKGQKFTIGTCPALNSYSTTTITFSTLVNTWREIARTTSHYRHGWKCVTYTFVEVTPNIKYAFSVTGVKKGGGLGRASGVLDIFNGNGGVSGPGTYFRTTITYGQKAVTLNYYIARVGVTADYIALYTCENFLFGKIESAIVLVLPNIEEEYIAIGFNALSQYGVDRNDLLYTYTNECL